MPTTEFVDYYELLDLPANASLEEIERRLQRELRAWVQKTNAPDLERRQAAERRVEDLSNAKRVLLHPDQRSLYDQERARRPARPPTAATDPIAPVIRADDDLVDRARAHLAEDDVASAVYEARLATERRPSDAEAWAVLAEAKLRWGKPDDALYEYDRAIELRPNHAPYHFGLATLHETQGHWGRALLHYERAAKCDGTEPAYKVAAGRLNLELGLTDKALPLLEQGVAAHPHHLELLQLLARALCETALRHFTKAGGSPAVVTSEEDATKAQELLHRADSLGFDDPTLRIRIRNHLAEADRALEEGWAYTPGNTALAAGLILLVTAVLWFLAPVLAVLVASGVTALWVRQGRQPVWKITARRVGHGAQATQAASAAKA